MQRYHWFNIIISSYFLSIYMPAALFCDSDSCLKQSWFSFKGFIATRCCLTADEAHLLTLWVRFTAGELIHRSCVIPASFSVFFALDLDPSLTLVVHLCRLLLLIISSDERKAERLLGQNGCCCVTGSEGCEGWVGGRVLTDLMKVLCMFEYSCVW